MEADWTEPMPAPSCQSNHARLGRGLVFDDETTATADAHSAQFRKPKRVRGSRQAREGTRAG